MVDTMHLLLLITFEHVVLDNTRVERACMWLNEKGYSTCREGQNIVAIALPD